MRTVRTHPLLVGGFFLVTIALAVAGIVWWLIPTEPLSAQEVMENACADFDRHQRIRCHAPHVRSRRCKGWMGCHGNQQRHRYAYPLLLSE